MSFSTAIIPYVSSSMQTTKATTEEIVAKCARFENCPPKSSIQLWHEVANAILQDLAKKVHINHPVRMSLTALEDDGIEEPQLFIKTKWLYPRYFNSFSQLIPEYTTFCYNTVTQNLPLEELEGAIAHELGHLVNDDSREKMAIRENLKNLKKLKPQRLLITMCAENRFREYRADAFAVKLGLGKGLLAFLKRTRDALPFSPIESQILDKAFILSKHPPLEKRIACIEQQLRK